MEHQITPTTQAREQGCTRTGHTVGQREIQPGEPAPGSVPRSLAVGIWAEPFSLGLNFHIRKVRPLGRMVSNGPFGLYNGPIFQV